MADSLCPSARAEPDAQLLGTVEHDGEVAFFDEPLPIDHAFVEVARLRRRPEMRFRFASPCVEGRCTNWSGARCQIADALVAHTESTAVPRCAIRKTCRWFAQVGTRACGPCRSLITDTQQED